MLDELEIRSLGPIRQTRITPHRGMNAITGETGAGKSMLLNAVELISGANAQPARVSADADYAWVQAIFDVTGNAAVCALAADAGTQCVDNQLFISRSVPKTGRSRSVLNGQTVPRNVLSSISSELVTIHGQSEQLKIAASTKQREFLDGFADNQAQRNAYSQAFDEYSTLKNKIDQLKSAQSQAVAQIDYLKDAIARIDSVNPQSGEDTELRVQRDYIENAAQIAVAQHSAMQALDGEDEHESSVTELLNRAIHSLREVDNIDKIAELITRLESVSEDVQDIVYTLSQVADSDVNPQDLDAINARIYELDELTKRWGPTLADVLAWKEKAQFDLEDLDASPERIEELEEELKQRLKIAHTCANELSQTRAAAAEELGEKVTAELSSLAMEGAAFRVMLTQSNELDAFGRDSIAFEFMPFPGSAWLPLGKSASGGELSRLMLALELVAFEKKHTSSVRAHETHIPTLIFDEIDAGVGGKAAAELGKRLARLAQGAQILVVTHLPQVAAWADKQFVVAKEKSENQTTTSVTEVAGDERVREIARMLSGTQSETSLQHASELLKECTL